MFVDLWYGVCDNVTAAKEVSGLRFLEFVTEIANGL